MQILNGSAGERKKTFQWLYRSMSNGIRNVKSTEAQEWLKKNGLSYEMTGAGFCSGQVQHRKSKEFIRGLENVRFLRANNIVSKNGDTGYLIFAKFGIIFPLKDVKGEVVNFYGIRIRLEKPEHSFLNDEGIYPCFPHEMTTRLFITTNILDAATILESRVLENRDAVICVPGGNFLKQYEEAIERLGQLKSIHWIESPRVKLTEPLRGRTMPELIKTKSHE
ncbi:MAG: hypothetical protein IT233_12735 [Bacteroidia bacterium]|nr:hypothetical protein [Bacteroidia bacterium]